MGGCLSRKRESSSLNASSTDAVVPDKSFSLKEEPDVNIKEKLSGEGKVMKQLEEGLTKKEIFVIKHRKSHDREKPSTQENWVVSALPNVTHINPSSGVVEMGNDVSHMVVRTSSCAKEEVDAILIQCGRLSRSNSFGAGKTASSCRKYSGHKRSYDLDHNDLDQDVEIAPAATYDSRKINDDEDDELAAERRQHRQRQRRPSPSSSQGRRRTPSREREQRSGSRERDNGSSSSGRRVSRSPGRRSETTPTAHSNCASNVNNTTSRPGKMVSVPATVSSLTMDKGTNGVESQTETAFKRISVKRNVGDAAMPSSRGAASPRSQSPARTSAKGSNENNHQQPSLSRSSSRKAEQSPYRRNPLSEIDPNSLVYAQATGNNKTACINNNNSSSRVQIRNKEIEGQAVFKESISVLNQAQMQKPNAENNNRPVAQGTNCRGNSNIVKEAPVIMEEAEVQLPSSTLAASGADLKPQTLTRTRSARRSRDLDFNPETLLNPNPSYTALLLEDIQNFHQKNATTTAPSFSVPPCVVKARSIVEAVADLNSTTSSNLSCAFVEDRRSPTTMGASIVGKKLTEAKDPFVESEILASDDLMEPSFHKYVTMRRGVTSCGEDMDEQESSGSNSFVGGSQQYWGYSTSSWEPNSADSTDRWTSRSNTREEDEKNPSGFQKHAVLESGRNMEEAMRGFSGQMTGIGRGRAAASSKNLHSNLIVAATAST